MTKRRKNYFTHILLVVLLIMGMIAMTACGKKESNSEGANTETPMAALETKYLTMTYPEDYKDLVKHREVVQDAITMEIFSMVQEETDMELFRIYFNDAAMGTLSGYLVIGSDEIPVTFDVAIYEDEDFSSEKHKEEYYRVMDVFTHVMDSVYNHPQFQEEKYIKPVCEQDNTMKYWKVTLPENVQWQEQTDTDVYSVEFYGEIQGETVSLYSISLGEVEADYSIGTFKVDNGEAKPVWVKIYDLGDHPDWQEEDYTIAYRMLESVNSVIEQIMSSKNFSET